MTSNKLISQADERAKSWNSFFARLAQAEHAAANQCLWLSSQFSAMGELDLAANYAEMAKEEFGHANLVLNVCRSQTELTDVMAQIYSGERLKCAGHARIVEVLALIHLCFEPSAMAFLSFIHKEAHNFFEKEWADTVSSNFSVILKEESLHIKSGKKIVRRFLKELSSEEVKAITSSIGSNRRFIIGGIRRSFRTGSDDLNLAKLLEERYEFAFQNAISGVLNGNNKKRRDRAA